MELLYKIINFAIFSGALYLLLRKPIRDFFSSRSSSMSDMMSAAGRAFEAAHRESERVHLLLKDLANESAEIKRVFLETASAEGANIVANAKAYAEQIRTDASTFTEHEVAKAMNAVKSATARSIFEVVVKNLSEKAGPSGRNRMVKSSVKEIDKCL